MQHPSVAAYVLANDRAYGWLHAFVHSFRHWNPDLPLYLIPYDDQHEEALRVVRRFGGELYRSHAIQWADAQCACLCGGSSRGVGKYRRLALLFDAAPISFYFDSDVVITHPLDPLAQAFRAHDAALAYADAWSGAYRDKALAERMRSEYGSREFCSGALAIKPGRLLSQDRAESLIQEIAPRRRELFSRNDQSLLNWFVDLTGSHAVSFADVLEGVSQTHIPRRRRRLRFDARGAIVKPGDPQAGKRCICCHWPGYRADARMPCARVFLRWRLAGLPPAERTRYLAVFHAQGWSHALARLPSKYHRSFVKRLRALRGLPPPPRRRQRIAKH